MNAPFRRSLPRLLAATALLASLGLAQTTGERKNPTSRLYVVEIEGEPRIDNGERVETLSPKAVHSAQGVILDTPDASRSSVVLSNSTGLSFAPGSRLEVRRFLQEPFAPNRTDFEVEPSLSQTAAFLHRGVIGICTPRLVAGSTMVYTTPHVAVWIRGLKVAIEVEDDETRVTLFEGDVTLRGDSLAGGEVLKPGQQAVVTRPNPAEPPRILVRDTPADKVAALEDQVTRACLSRRTVFFDVANQTGPGAEGAGELFPVELVPGDMAPPQVVSPSRLPGT